MTMETKTILGIMVQIFFILFMLGSGIWVALDARKHGRPPREYIVWGLVAGWFIFLGLIIYILWRRYFFNQCE